MFSGFCQSIKTYGMVGIFCFFRFIWAVVIENVYRGTGQFSSAQELKEKQIMIRGCILSKKNGFMARLAAVVKNKGSQTEHDFQKV